MDHETASSHLAELIRGRLSPSEAAEVEQHVASCAECRDVDTAMRRVARESSIHGADLFTAHPRAADLAVYALESGDLATAALTEIAAHVRACPSCGYEVDTARRARAGAWSRMLGAWLSGETRAVPGWLGPALAVLAIALLYPGYLGLVRYPREREAARQAALQAHAAQTREAELRQTVESQGSLASSRGAGGPASALLLSAPTRGATAPLATLTLRKGQTLIPLLVDYALGDGGARSLNRAIEIRIFATGRTDPVWRCEAHARELWNESIQAVSLLVPATALGPGIYRFTLATKGAPNPEFEARFRVTTAS